ncbi:MAG: hypothetical protein IKX22_05670 [Prevotella sp.]|nr:hypothetical protein [Prevotella sp.]
MYCKCKETPPYPHSHDFYIGEVNICYWYDNGHTQVCISRAAQWNTTVIIDRDDFLRCFDYWE